MAIGSIGTDWHRQLVRWRTRRINPERTARSWNFGDCSVALRNILYQYRPLDEAEFWFMDYHFQIVEMAYLR